MTPCGRRSAHLREGQGEREAKATLQWLFRLVACMAIRGYLPVDLWTRRDWLKSVGAGLLGLTTQSLWAQVGLPVEHEDMIVIPAGPALLGTSAEDAERLARAHGHHPSWLAGEVPARRIHLPAFAIDRCPVTNGQYAQFCRATGHRPPMHWGGPEPPEHLLNHPVVCVNLADAEAYARWAGKRLPTEAEWEKAARGPEGLLYPWGNEFRAEYCCWDRGVLPGGPHTDPVEAHPEGASPYGVMDMVGNAAEWCADGPGPGAVYVKGGCWLTAEPLNLRPAARNLSGFANNALPYIGFRCARDVE